MGTTWSLRLAGSRSVDLERVARTTREVLAEVDARLSTWREDSDLSRLSASRSLESFPVARDTALVLATARDVGAASSGALDVTIAPLVDLWGFGPRATVRWPTDAEIEAALERVGGHHLEVVVDPPSVRKLRPDVAVDASAVAKGYAVDRVVAALVGEGGADFLFELGGEVAARGHKADGTPWIVGIEAPFEEGPRLQRSLPLLDRALATSGDYRRYVLRDGRRLSHILDPTTGRPVTHALAAVTVVHESAAVADAWATALLVLGPEQGERVARREGLAALLLERQDDGVVERTTPAFELLLQAPSLAPPGPPPPARPAVAWLVQVVLAFVVLAAAATAFGLGRRACARRRLGHCAAADAVCAAHTPSVRSFPALPEDSDGPTHDRP
jgi:thiamine biosynthesis lipoprotein